MIRVLGNSYKYTVYGQSVGASNITGTLPISKGGTGATSVANALNNIGMVAGSFLQVGAATTTFTVPIGTTQADTTYHVEITPTSVLAAAFFYVTNKTTTTFDVTYLSAITGSITFDWYLSLQPNVP